jgi:hypothetical protein
MSYVVLTELSRNNYRPTKSIYVKHGSGHLTTYFQSNHRLTSRLISLV